MSQIVAVYADRVTADRAVESLLAGGIDRAEISVRTEQELSSPSPTPATGTSGDKEGGGFLSWLFGSDEEYDVPERHQQTMYRGIRERGQAVVVVRTGDTETDHDRVSTILEGHDPVSLDDQDEHAAASTGTLASDPANTSRDGETVIPVVEEQLAVGKRQVRRANAYRLRTTVEEVPVEQDVTLRDERVVVERRPVSGRTPSGDTFREQTVEVHETHEEPVVQKTAQQTEEVVVRKDVDEHVETVRDNVRRTRVDVDEGTKDRQPRSRR